MKKSLTREERLRNLKDFKALRESDKRVMADGLKLISRENAAGVNRIAIIVARGCGGSVRRNREKRLTREAFRGLKSELRQGRDLLFIIGRFGQSYSERRETLRRLFTKADLHARMD